MVEILRSYTSQEVVLVNPNPGHEYKDSVRSVEYVFPPLKKVLVEKRLAMELLSQAQVNKSNVAMQHTAEMNEYRRLIGHQDAGLRNKALSFVDKDGEPVTKLWKRDPLVRLDEAPGLKAYEEAVAEAKQMGIPVPEDEEMGAGATLELETIDPNWNVHDLLAYIDKNGGSGSPVEGVEKLRKKAEKLREAQVQLLKRGGLKAVDATAKPQ